MAECARASSLFRNRRITVVPSGIDTSSFRPLPQKEARAILGIAPDRKCVLFAAMNGARNPIKGFKYLSEALRILARDGKATRLELLVLGDSSIPDPKSLGVPVRCLGHLGDDLTIAMIHAASDVFVAPSVQENLANTVIEALACGRPAVAFRVGGMPDMIHHQVNGALADPLDPLSLAREIDWVLADEARWSVLSARAREIAVQTHSLDLHARRYLDLYEETVHGDSDAAAQRLST